MSLPLEFIADPDNVFLDLHADSGEAAVRALHARLANVNAVADAPLFLAGLLERMHVAPVCVAEDIALPHARTNAVTRLVVAVGRAPTGIAFDAQHPQVRLVFLIGIPKDAVTEYLRVVAMLSRRLRQPGAIPALMAAVDEAEFRTLLAGGVATPR